MKKVSYSTKMPYDFNPNHKTTRYYYAEQWHNGGEWIEAVLKYERGYKDYYKKDSTPYYKGSDIEAEQASVKTCRSTLARIYGETVQEILAIYLNNVKSKRWYFVTYRKNEITEWQMDKLEFVEFILNFGILEYNPRYKRKVIRIPDFNYKIYNWLLSRVN